MVSLIFTRTNFLKPPVFNTLLSFSPKRFHCRRKAVIFNLVLGKNMCSFQFFNKLRKERTEDSVYCWCKKGDMELEEEILAFMKLSENPNAFPTRKELEKAGRVDLIEAIKKRGGWFSFGWEIEDDDKNVNANEVETVEMDFDIEEFHRRVESCQDSDLLHGNEAHLPASSSGRSIETVAEEDSGIEGILSRLEKERNSSLGIDLGKHGHISHTLSRDNIYDRSFGTTDAAGEVALGKSWIEGTTETLGDDVVNITEKRSKALQRLKNDNHNEISTRLQHLELELSLTLRSLKSKSEELSSKEVFGSSPSDLQRLSDACEFQENEIMSARERLRLIRAQLAVLEGKMLLAIIDAQKMLDEKQKRIDSASKALQLLRTARIVWTNSASEVLLAGSFDGWTTQRKMEKLHTGVFAVSLKLYPGRYEVGFIDYNEFEIITVLSCRISSLAFLFVQIKFIVDGIWKIDPLRPTVHNNRHENNLLIIT
ncbi:protein PTST homolog 2, chloroplastic-like isoform X3 [Lycium ferocissimum]|uniref:protein PTST homolog 2, chloroplastic-like isoform X3 n=1 Tax=Lycium ferocissimum TaxID=112874 RepID=UPI0028157DB3|nr:protein PTST homolog 2, chloroplastic-like isoform X3 [Lycium ferocissimum]